MSECPQQLTHNCDGAVVKKRNTTAASVAQLDVNPAGLSMLRLRGVSGVTSQTPFGASSTDTSSVESHVCCPAQDCEEVVSYERAAGDEHVANSASACGSLTLCSLLRELRLCVSTLATPARVAEQNVAIRAGQAEMWDDRAEHNHPCRDVESLHSCMISNAATVKEKSECRGETNDDASSNRMMTTTTTIASIAQHARTLYSCAVACQAQSTQLADKLHRTQEKVEMLITSQNILQAELHAEKNRTQAQQRALALLERTVDDSRWEYQRAHTTLMVRENMRQLYRKALAVSSVQDAKNSSCRTGAADSAATDAEEACSATHHMEKSARLCKGSCGVHRSSRSCKRAACTPRDSRTERVADMQARLAQLQARCGTLEDELQQRTNTCASMYSVLTTVQRVQLNRRNDRRFYRHHEGVRAKQDTSRSSSSDCHSSCKMQGKDHLATALSEETFLLRQKATQRNDDDDNSEEKGTDLCDRCAVILPNHDHVEVAKPDKSHRKDDRASSQASFCTVSPAKDSSRNSDGIAVQHEAQKQEQQQQHHRNEQEQLQMQLQEAVAECARLRRSECMYANRVEQLHEQLTEALHYYMQGPPDLLNNTSQDKTNKAAADGNHQSIFTERCTNKLAATDSARKPRQSQVSGVVAHTTATHSDGKQLHAASSSCSSPTRRAPLNTHIPDEALPLLERRCIGGTERGGGGAPGEDACTQTECVSMAADSKAKTVHKSGKPDDTAVTAHATANVVRTMSFPQTRNKQKGLVGGVDAQSAKHASTVVVCTGKLGKDSHRIVRLSSAPVTLSVHERPCTMRTGVRATATHPERVSMAMPAAAAVITKNQTPGESKAQPYRTAHTAPAAGHVNGRASVVTSRHFVAIHEVNSADGQDVLLREVPSTVRPLTRQRSMPAHVNT